MNLNLNYILNINLSRVIKVTLIGSDALDLALIIDLLVPVEMIML